LAIIYLTLAQGQSHQAIENMVYEIVNKLKLSDITSLTKKIKAQAVTAELLNRQQSLSIAQELTEYVSAGDWTVYHRTVNTIESIKPKEVLSALRTNFNKSNLTIGYFNGLI
jgi:predicted Zn-dependent peptidase